MDFGKAFTYVFEDPDWVRKLGIGTLLMLLGILFSWLIIGLIPLIIILGYTVDVVRNVMNGERHPLPEWQDWGGFFNRGLKLFIAFFVWALPIIIVLIPVMIGGALTDSNRDLGGMEAIGILLTICGSCLMLLWSLVLTLFTPAIYVRFASTGRLSSAFEFGKLWGFTQRNLGDVIVSIILVLLAGLIAAVAGMLGFVALLIGALITIPAASLWQYLVQSHLFGQIGAKDRASVLGEIDLS